MKNDKKRNKTPAVAHSSAIYLVGGLQVPYDVPSELLLLLGDERVGGALDAGPARSADPVRVRVDVAGHVEVDDVADVRDVEAARRHVRRHQDGELSLLEGVDDGVALVLRQVAVNAADVELFDLEVLRELITVLLLGDEDQHGALRHEL